MEKIFKNHAFYGGRTVIINHCIDEDLYSITYVSSHGSSGNETAYMDNLIVVENMQQYQQWWQVWDWHNQEQAA